MSYQTGTTHYNLPQTVGTDKRDWFDTNQAYADVDAALYGVVQQNATDHSDIATMKGDISDLKAADTQFGLDLAETNGRVTTLEQHEGADAEAIQDLADMFCPLEEAAAEADVAVANGRMFRYNGVLYRATADIAIGDTIVPNTNCVATNMENELDNSGTTVTAAEVTYDNTSSGLTADDVQEAIDEINTSLSQLPKQGQLDYANKIDLKSTLGTVSGTYTVLKNGILHVDVTDGSIQIMSSLFSSTLPRIRMHAAGTVGAPDIVEVIVNETEVLTTSVLTATVADITFIPFAS